MTEYYKYWNIQSPVFIKKSSHFIELDFQTNIIQEIELFLSTSQKSIGIVGPAGTGKKTITEFIYNKLPISSHQCIELRPASATSQRGALTRKILKFLKTNISNRKDAPSTHADFCNELSFLKKQKQTLVVFLDFTDHLNSLPEVYYEFVLLAGTAQKRDLPLKFIISIDEQLTLADDEFVDRFDKTVFFDAPSKSELEKYVKEKLIASELSPDFFSKKTLELILSATKNRLEILNRFCENILVELAHKNQKKADSQFIFDFISRHTRDKQNDFQLRSVGADKIKESRNQLTEHKKSQNYDIEKSTKKIVEFSKSILPAKPENQSQSHPKQPETRLDKDENIPAILSTEILDPSADSCQIIHEETVIAAQNLPLQALPLSKIKRNEQDEVAKRDGMLESDSKLEINLSKTPSKKGDDYFKKQPASFIFSQTHQFR